MTDNAYLVGLRLAGKKVVVVGGGTVAQRRLPLLIATGADIHVVSRSATPAVEAMSGITLTLRPFEEGDLDGAWYVIAATDDPDVNAAIVDEAERRRIFCVRADAGTGGHPRSRLRRSSTRAWPSACSQVASTDARRRSGRRSTRRSSRV